MTVDGPDAPWCQKELPEHEIEVTISVTLSKTVKVRVNDYRVEEDIEDGNIQSSYDYSDCDLYRAVENQVTLPQDLAVFTERMFNHDLDLRAAGMPKYLKDSIKDCKDWSVDDMEIILE